MKPNILLIMTDQQRGDCLSAEGHPVLQTPVMDGIGESGVRFSRFYSACPTCIAARRSILSGQKPAAHGMVGYMDGVPWDAPVTLPQALRQGGYQTYLVGRSMHQHPPRKRFGYDEMELYGPGPESDYGRWLAENGPSGSGGVFGGGVMHNDWNVRPWPLEEHLHPTNWTIGRALRFLERRDPSVPYFLTVSFIAPHPPLLPPDFYLETYLRTGVDEPVIGDWASPPEYGKGEFAHDGKLIRDHVSADKVALSGDRLLLTRAAYYGLISHADTQLRRLLNPINGVNSLGERNTIICFTSDHGEMLGDHYMWRKSFPYEPSARVPFLLSAPPGYGFEEGKTIDFPATHADIMPTLLDMAGLSVPDSVEGRSLLPAIRGEESEERRIHIEHAPYHHSLTDGKIKYIWFVNDGGEQFFDLQKDPREQRDLSGDPAQQERIRKWRNHLVRELEDRPEGFSDGKRLIPGKIYRPVLSPKTQ